MVRAKKHLFSFIFLSLLFLGQAGLLLAVQPAMADNSLWSSQSLLKDSTANNYGSNPKDIKVIILTMLKTVLQFTAIILVILIVIAGFKYMTSGGNEAKVKDALGQIKALAIGLLIVFAAWGITKYVLNFLVCVTTDANVVCPTRFW